MFVKERGENIYDKIANKSIKLLQEGTSKKEPKNLITEKPLHRTSQRILHIERMIKMKCRKI